MKDAILLVVATFIALAAPSCAWAVQTPQPITVGTPTPIADPYRNLHVDAARNRTIPREKELNETRDQMVLRARYVDPLYRDPGAQDLKAVAVDPEIRGMFSTFLSQPNTGIIKLALDLGCPEHTRIVAASAECRQFPFPGAGSAFSFRRASYRGLSLADISYRGSEFQAPGALTLGIFVKLGDVPVERIDLRSNGVSYLAEYKSSSDTNRIADEARRFRAGIVVGGLTYSSTAAIEMNMTYALRSIAYRGTVVRSIEGVIYDELDYDTRADVIVVFRTVGFEQNGNLIVVWKKLKTSQPPKVKG